MPAASRTAARTARLARAARRAAALALPAALALTAAAWTAPAQAHAATADPAATAATYVVATTGNDANPGTAERPFRTVTKGLKAVRPGGKLLLRAGTYTERIINPAIAAGTATAPVTVANYPGERPVIAGLLWLNNPTHWTLTGINVTWNTAANHANEHMIKINGGANWTLAGAEIWGTRSYAAVLVTGAAKNWRIAHNNIHDTYPTNGTNQDHLIYVNNDGAGTIEGNTLANSPNGRAIKLGPPSAGAGNTRGVTIRYNTMANNLGPSNIQLAWGTYDTTIYRNIMVKPAANRSAITAYQLTGTGNTTRDNLAWQTPRVADTAPGLTTTGGNILRDPKLSATLTPTDTLAAAYGATADPTR